MVVGLAIMVWMTELTASGVFAADVVPPAPFQKRIGDRTRP